MVAAQLDDGDSDRRCDEDKRTGGDEETACTAGPPARRPARGCLKHLVVGKDGSFELLQGGAGLEPELAGERPAALSVDLECFRLPAGAVEGEHQLSPQPF